VNQKKFLVITLMLIAFAATSSALAQNSSSAKKDAAKSSTANDDSQPNPDDFIELLRKDVRSQKKQIIAENMDLSDAEARGFGRSTIDMPRSSPGSTTRKLPC
jgi:Ni/Co efflux regulator RcnB